MKKSSLALAMTLVLGSVDASAASLQPGDHLSIDAGSYSIWGGGAYGTVPLLGEQGITVGSAQGDTGSGSHGGTPVAADVGAVTQPWNFFFNTGYEYFSTNGSGSFGGDTTNGVDMTAWTMTWNGIANIPMGGCFLGAGGCTIGSTVFTDTGIGIFNWSGVYGDSYTISYVANMPVVYNFDGIQVDWYLTGIVTSAIPVPSAFWLLASGLFSLFAVTRRKPAPGKYRGG